MAGGRSSQLLAAALALLAAVTARPAVGRAEGRGVPAMFVFGDSVFDVGNNNFLPRSMAKINFPPNGVDFPGGRPTGRFSNGYNMADYFGQFYGFKRSPPAFLSLTDSQLKKKSVCKGINFASGGSGILNTTERDLGNAIPMDAQLQYFRTSLRSFTVRRCSTSRRTLLSRSVFLLSTGNNDLFTLYYSNTSRTHEYISIVASEYRRQLMTLYRLGARRFGILGAGLLGCCPYPRTLTASGGCVAELNTYALQFNLALRKILEKLSSKYKGMKYSLGDRHKLATMVLNDTSSYGFKEGRRACCGGGRFNGQSACIPNATLCPNREDYFFWDWYHVTAAAAGLEAQVFYTGPPTLASPINFRELTED